MPFVWAPLATPAGAAYAQQAYVDAGAAHGPTSCGLWRWQVSQLTPLDTQALTEN
jgi:hypothetical protein